MQKIRVILADDHNIVRAGIRQFLEAAGDIDVVGEAADGETAKDLISQYTPDVAVLDVQMPKATGIEVARWSKTNAIKTGILILTAYDDDPYVLAVLQAGANGYVLKTAFPDDIVQAVRDVRSGKVVLDPSIAGAVTARLVSKPADQIVEDLSERELEVLRLVAMGYTNKAIGVQLNISDRTVQGHLAHIFNKLQASSRTEAVMRGVALGWISQDTGNLTK